MIYVLEVGGQRLAGRLHALTSVCRVPELPPCLELEKLPCLELESSRE